MERRTGLPYLPLSLRRRCRPTPQWPPAARAAFIDPAPPAGRCRRRRHRLRPPRRPRLLWPLRPRARPSREPRYRQGAPVSAEGCGTVREPRHPPQARAPLPGPGGGGSALTSRSGRAGEPRPASPVSRSFQPCGEKGMCARACPRSQLPPWERLSRG